MFIVSVSFICFGLTLLFIVFLTNYLYILMFICQCLYVHIHAACKYICTYKTSKLYREELIEAYNILDR